MARQAIQRSGREAVLALTIALAVVMAMLVSANGEVAAAVNGSTVPSFSKTFAPDIIGPGSTTTLTFEIDNSDNPGTPAGELAFSDTLPAEIRIADPAGATNSCGGVLSAPDGGGTISLTDGGVGAGDTCSINVNVTSDNITVDGGWQNTTGDLTSTLGNSGTAFDELFVDGNLPGFSKVFSPATIPLGGTSTLTFTIDNTANTSALDLLGFTDPLPAGMVVGTPSNATTDCGFTGSSSITADPGTSIIFYTAIGVLPSLPAVGSGQTCAFSVDVTTTTTGVLGNVTSDLEYSDAVLGSGTAIAGFATATLEVPVRPLSKVFLDDPTPPGGTVNLQFTIVNPSRTEALTGIAFTDVLTDALAGLSAAPPPTPDPPCGAGSSLTGTTTLTFVGGSLPPEGSCTFTVPVSVPAGATPGDYVNTTSVLTGTLGGDGFTGNKASDTLTVNVAPTFTKEFTDDPVGAGGTVTLEFTLNNTTPTGFFDLEFDDLLGETLPGLAANVLVDGDTDDPFFDVCGDGSTLSVFNPPDIIIGAIIIVTPPDPTILEFRGGVLDEAGQAGDSCTFSIELDLPVGAAHGVYLNTTTELTGSEATEEPITGPSATDDLIVVGAVNLGKEFTDDPVPPGGSVTLEFTLNNSNDEDSAVGISFTDDLAALTPPLAGLVATGLPASDICGAGSSLTASAGDTLLTFADGTLSAGGSCTFSVTLSVPAAAASGTYTNATSAVTATVGAISVIGPAVSDGLVVNPITFAKEFIDDPIIPGAAGTLRFTITNNGTATVTLTSFSDGLSTTLSGLAATGSPTADTCGGTLSGTTSIAYLGGSVDASSFCTIDVPILVPLAAANGTHHNTTSALVTSVGTVAAATDNLVVDDVLLALAKEFTGDPVVPGGSVSLEFRLENLSATETVTDIGFSDDLGAALSGLTATGATTNTCGGGAVGMPLAFPTTNFVYAGGSLDPGATCTIALTVEVPAGAPVGTFANTTSALAGKVGALDVGGSAASDDLSVIGVTFSKAFDGPIAAGDTGTLSFTITNLEATNAIGGLAFTDDLSAVLSGLVATDLPKSNVCGIGSILSFAGSTVSLTGGNLAASGSCTFSATIYVPSDTAAGPYLNATSDLFASGLVVAPPAPASLFVDVVPNVSVTKDDGVTSAVPGQDTLTYTTVVANAGPSDEAAVAVDDTFPAGLTCSWTSVAAGGATGNSASSGAALADSLAMPAGSSVTYTVNCSIASNATGTLSNTVTAVPSNMDGDPSDNTATDADTVLVPVADIAVTKDDGVTSAIPGLDLISYTIVVANAGPSDDPAVTFADSFPAGLSCSYSSAAANGATGKKSLGVGNIANTLSMPAGSSVVYYLVCYIDPGATGTLSNTASAESSVTDPDPYNNAATDDDTVLTPEADISITKTDGVTLAVPGQDTLTYTIVVANDGPSDDPAVSVTDAFPAGLTCAYTSVAAGGASGNTAAGAGDLAETLSMPVGSSVTYTATCAVGAGATGTLSNTATATASVTDPDPYNNAATDDDTVLKPKADISVTKTDGASTVEAGATLVYTVKVTNAGPSDAVGVVATETLPADTSLTKTTGCAEGPVGVPTCSLGTIAAGASKTYTVEVKVDSLALEDPITNNVSVASATIDPSSLNNTAIDVTTVEAGAPEVGLFNPTNGLWSLRLRYGGILTFTFGDPGDKAVMGDWNGDGHRTPGVFRATPSSTPAFYGRNSNSGGPADFSFAVGEFGDVPLSGDWNKNGRDSLALYRPSTQQFFVYDDFADVVVDHTLSFGDPGDVPLSVDLDNDVRDDIGVQRPSGGLAGRMYFRLSLTTGPSNGTLTFGNPFDRPVFGDWDHNGPATVGVYRPDGGVPGFYLRNSNTTGIADIVIPFGDGVETPVAGPF